MKFLRSILLALALAVGIGASCAPAHAAQQLLNNTYSRLAAAVAPGDTSITVTAGDGVKFASATGGNTIRATLVKISGFKEIAWEIVDITARATDTLTVTRARESTTALSFSIGDLVDVRFTAGVPFAHTDSTVAFTDTTDATSSTAAAVKTAGGLAVAKKVFIGSDTDIGGNLNFSGTAKRITGDFSNGTISNRTLFQSSTTNGNTLIAGIPNGSATITDIAAYGGSDPANSSFISIRGNGSTDTRITSSRNGTGTFLPILFFTNGVEALRIDTASHLKSSSTAPALTSCGTSPSITGSDSAGTVTMGTGSPTGCVITFATAYTSTAPHCVVTWQTNIASMQYTISATAITLTQTATSSNKVNYVCWASS